MKKIWIILLVSCIGFSMNLNAQKEKKAGVQPLVIKLTAEEFVKKVYNYNDGEKAVYLGKLPAIVDFYADWCRPCRMLSPILEELLKEYKGKIIIYKIDIETEGQLAGNMGVNSLPTLYFFPKKGKPVRTIGYQDKEALKKMIEEYLLP